jgi:hypothetical protein
MARAGKNSALNAISGQLGKQLVFKQYSDKTVISKYPDMDGVKPSRKQKNGRNLFKEAVAYAQKIIRNRELKKKYSEKVKPGKTVYHYAMQEYYLKNSK